MLLKKILDTVYLAVILGSLAPAVEAVSNHPFQVGPTGFFADWNSGNDYVVVTSVKSGGPANGIIEVDDIIWGVNGTSLADGYFTSFDHGRHKDPRVALGNAITDSEAGDGRIVFDVERGGVRQNRTVQLAITNTAYSATWPQSCPKSDLIIENTANRFISQINGDGLAGVKANFAALFLLATGEEAHLDAVRTMFSHLETSNVAHQGSSIGHRNNWYGSLSMIAMAEYYLRTGDPHALPHLQAAANHAFATETVGGWGHGWSVGQTGFVHADYVGSGLVNAVGGQVFVSVALARECGVTMSDADFEKSLRYYYQAAGVGAMSYGDHRYNDGDAVNGKLSLIGAGISMLNEPYASAAKMIGTQDALNASNFEGGHGGNFGNVLWRSITCGLIEDERRGAYRYMMDTMRWYFELCRGYNNSFSLLPAFDSTRYDDDSWGAMVGLNYVAARRNLRITGGPPTAHSVIRHVPEVVPKHHEYFLTTHAEGYQDSDYGNWMGDWTSNSTLEDIRKHMRHWHPKVRYHASIALGNRATNDNLSPLNSDGDPTNDLTDPAVDLVIEAIESNDARVRTAGLKAITGLEQFFTEKYSRFNYDEDDYRRMAPYVVDVIRNTSSDHWELDAATWAMVKVPVEFVRDNSDALRPLLEYEYTWFVRLGAYKALSRLSGEDLAPFYRELIECYVKEVNHQARASMAGSVEDDIDAIRNHISDTDLQEILEMLGDDLAGGRYRRDQGYQGAGGHAYEAQTMKALTEAFTLDELGSIADDINSSLSRYTNPRLQGDSALETYFKPLYRWLSYVDDPLWTATEEQLKPFYPGLKAMQLGGFEDLVTWDDRYGEAEEWVDFMNDELEAYESVNGLVEIHRSFDFTADPPQRFSAAPAPFPDHEDQGIHYELEEGSGTIVRNAGMNGFSADAEMTDANGWSNIGIAPHSNYSLDANKAWVAADNPHLRDRETTGRIEERIRDGSYVTSSWIRLNDLLPDEEAHYVVFSALYDFDFGVRRLNVGGEWKNTLFFESSKWGNPIYALNDSHGRPDIFLEEGKDYFIMFERRRNGEGDDKTLLHLYNPVSNAWQTSNGSHTLGNVNMDTRSFHIGIGSLDNDILDPATRFPGLIDSVQMWSHVNKTHPRTLSGKFTLARQNALNQVTESPSVLLDLRSTDGISALIDGHLAKAGPIGSVMTVYYGDNDGGTDPDNWDHSLTYPVYDDLEAQEILIEGLSPNGTYYVRAHAQNPVGAMLEYWTPQAIVFSTLSSVGDNEDPVADAGANAVAIDDDRSGTATVTLDGSSSTDNIAIQTYTWRDANGVTLSTGSDAIQSAEVPVGFQVITLTTTDFNGNTAQSQFEIDVIEGDDAAAPDADAGKDQVVADYNDDGMSSVEFDGSGSGSNGVVPTSYTWELNGNVIASGEIAYADLPVGEHFIILTVKAADGSYNVDSLTVRVLSLDETLLEWTTLDSLSDHLIIAAQDFKGMGEGIAQGSGDRVFLSTSAPNREIAFWPFTIGADKDASNVKSGITNLNDSPVPESFIIDTQGGTSSSEWAYFSDPVDIRNYTNCSIHAGIKIRGRHNSSAYLRVKVHMELDDGSTDVEELFWLGNGALDGRKPFIANYNIPTNADSVWVEVSGKSFLDWMGVDNVVLVGEIPSPATVETQAPDRITTSEARVKGRVVDNGKENPRIKVLYGTTDRGETAIGWDSEVDLGTRPGNFNTTLTGLSELTTYYYRIYASNTGGESFSPNAASFRTGSSTPVDAPQISASSATNISLNSARLNGQVDDAGGDNPRITIYFGSTDRGKTTNGWDDSFDLGYHAGSFNQSVSDLLPYRPYYYRIYAQNYGGNTWSDPIGFVTQDAGDSIYLSIQNNVFMTADSWDRGSIPGAGDIAVIDDNLRFNSADGSSFDADSILLSRQLRIDNSISFKNVTLYEGGDLHQYNSDDTATFVEINVLESSKLTYRGGRSRNLLVADRIVGSGELNWLRDSSISDLSNLAQIDCPDMTGFTGLLKIGGVAYSGGPVDLTQDISAADASFAMHVVGDGNFFVLSGDVAVTRLTVAEDNFAAGTYTLDTVANPGAIDLSNLNGRDYSPFFGDLGGTITVTEAPPATLLPNVVAYEETGITVSGATIHGEVTDTGGQSPNIKLFYGKIDRGASTTGWERQIDLGIHSGTFSHALSALDHNTQYFYRIHAENAAGGTFTSDTGDFITLELKAPIVEVRPAGAVTADAARLRGMITEDGNIPTEVTFYYGASDGREVASSWEHSINIGEHNLGSVSTFLTSLAEGQTYYYRIYVSNTAGGSWSRSQRFAALTPSSLVYLHRFNGAGGAQLHGVEPDIRPGSEVWDNANSSSSNVFADGAVSGGGSKRRGIWLPFTPVSGNIYTLSAEILTTDSGEGIVMCFAQYNENNRWSDSIINGYGAIRVPQERENRTLHTYTGAIAAGHKTIPSAAVPEFGYVSTSILLDASDDDPANWTVEFFVDGVSVRAPETAASGSFGDIRYLGFSRNTGGGRVRDLTLKRQIPVSIVDFATWLQAKLPTPLMDAYNGNPGIDFDGDGLSLIKEYYFRKDPMNPDSSGLFEYYLDRASGQLSARYQRRRNHDGVIAIHQSSNDLVNWTTLNGTNEAVSTFSEEIEDVEVSIPSGSNHQFIRVQLERR